MYPLASITTAGEASRTTTWRGASTRRVKVSVGESPAGFELPTTKTPSNAEPSTRANGRRATAPARWPHDIEIFSLSRKERKEHEIPAGKRTRHATTFSTFETCVVSPPP